MSRYDSDPLAGPPGSWKVPPRGHTVPLPVELGQVVEDVASGFVGEIVAFEQGIVVLEDRHRVRRSFRLGPGFWVDGNPVELSGTGVMAQALQHETDHLDGLLYLDRLDKENRRAAMKEVRESAWF